MLLPHGTEPNATVPTFHILLWTHLAAWPVLERIDETHAMAGGAWRPRSSRL